MCNAESKQAQMSSFTPFWMHHAEIPLYILMAGRHTYKKQQICCRKRPFRAAATFTNELQEVNSENEMSYVVITTSNVSWGLE